MGLINEHKYDDIINLPHHTSTEHPQMALYDRAAQFSPFAALAGHDAAIREAARRTEEFVELDEGRKEQLDEQLRLLRENQSQQPEIEVLCFQPDQKKSGGAYVRISGRVKKVDEYKHQIVFTDGTALPMENLYSIEGELFGGIMES